MKKAALTVATLIILPLAVAIVRALNLPSRQLDVEPVTDIAVDAATAAERLATALTFRTVSYQDSAHFEPDEFLRLHQYLRTTFPLVDSTLPRETVGGYSLLYRWIGSDRALSPLLLMAHMDVVPVQPGTEGDWTLAPFGGDIVDGYVWGRGALDDKGSLVAIFEAVEALLARGFRPRRSVYLAFGHDEEVGGGLGAGHIARLLSQRGVRLAFVVDEGGVVADGVIPGMSAPVALVGVAEKGYLSVELTVRAQGGHSSAPPEETSIGILSRAVGRLERNPMPRDVRGATALMFDYLAPEMGFGHRLVLGNRWLLGWAAERAIGAAPSGDALLRTTTAPTIFQAGVKDNVIPPIARAVVNFRILPGDSVGGVLQRVRRTIDDPRVEIATLGGSATEASRVSDVTSDNFHTLHRTIRQVFPAAIVAPWLVIGGTDARYYWELTPDVYRFSGGRLTPEDLNRFHGTNERIGVEDYGRMIRFYIQLLRNAAG